jgi:hypothetical protein
VAARSKAWVCGRSFVGIVGLNPARDLDVSCACFVVQVEVTAKRRSLVQRNPTEFGVSECDRGTS